MVPLQNEISEQRRNNRKRVYESLYFSDVAKTKKELATELGLSLPTINQNLTELFEANLVCSFQGEQYTGGRKAAVLDIISDAYYSIGIAIAEINIRMIITDLRLREVGYKKIKYHVNSFENEIGDLVANELKTFIQSSGIDATKIIGVGIAIPGLLDKENKKILFAPTLKVRNISYDFFQSQIPYPVFVENDGTAGGLAEYFSNHEQKNMAYFLLENGVGGAVVINGQSYLGDNVCSGEFGHICVEPNGLECSCGKRGCLEPYCTARRFSDDIGISLEEFFEGIKKGNKLFISMWEDMLKHLAIGIHNTRIVLDCDVVLGGFMAQYIEPYLYDLKQYVMECNFFDKDADYIRLCNFGNKSVCMGMALHFVQEFMNEF